MKYKLNLQFFSEGEAPIEPQAEEKTYSQAELDEMLQKETDRRVSSAIKKQRATWEEEYKTKVELERKEAEKLAKLSADERAKAEFDKQKKAFEEERKTFQRQALELETSKQLAEMKLPTQFASFLITEMDAEKVKGNIEVFANTFQEAVQMAVEERLKGGSVPKAPTQALSERQQLEQQLQSASSLAERIAIQNKLYTIKE